MEAVLFYVFSALAVGSALWVILLHRPTRALLSLIVTMASLSVLYLLLGAYFVAIAQIIVYAGAVLVLFLFVIMLQGVGAREIPFFQRFSPVLIFLMIAAALSFVFGVYKVFSVTDFPSWEGVVGSVEAVGLSLFTDFLLPFELTAILLLLSVFAAVALAKPEESK